MASITFSVNGISQLAGQMTISSTSNSPQAGSSAAPYAPTDSSATPSNFLQQVKYLIPALGNFDYNCVNGTQFTAYDQRAYLLKKNFTSNPAQPTDLLTIVSQSTL